jgi:hypothetical protein
MYLYKTPSHVCSWEYPLGLGDYCYWTTQNKNLSEELEGLSSINLILSRSVTDTSRFRLVKSCVLVNLFTGQ